MYNAYTLSMSHAKFGPLTFITHLSITSKVREYFIDTILTDSIIYLVIIFSQG